MNDKEEGRGLVSTVINRAVGALPVEGHLPGYKFCGPGTKLSDGLARGDRGINQLDDACREHNMAYVKYTDNERQREADCKLVEKAWEREKAWNSGVSERAYAAAFAAAMKAKSASGGGKKEKKITCKTK